MEGRQIEGMDLLFVLPYILWTYKKIYEILFVKNTGKNFFWMFIKKVMKLIFIQKNF